MRFCILHHTGRAAVFTVPAGLIVGFVINPVAASELGETRRHSPQV